MHVEIVWSLVEIQSALLLTAWVTKKDGDCILIRMFLKLFYDDEKIGNFTDFIIGKFRGRSMSIAEAALSNFLKKIWDYLKVMIVLKHAPIFCSNDFHGLNFYKTYKPNGDLTRLHRSFLIVRPSSWTNPRHRRTETMIQI